MKALRANEHIKPFNQVTLDEYDSLADCNMLHFSYPFTKDCVSYREAQRVYRERINES